MAAIRWRRCKSSSSFVLSGKLRILPAHAFAPSPAITRTTSPLISKIMSGHAALMVPYRVKQAHPWPIGQLPRTQQHAYTFLLEVYWRTGTSMITPKQREHTMDVSQADFRKVMGHFATGVTVVTTCDDQRRLGITVNAFSSLSLDPPLILVCIEKTSYLHQVMIRNGYFAVNLLGEDQRDLCTCFAGRSEARRNFCDTPSHTAVTGRARAGSRARLAGLPHRGCLPWRRPQHHRRPCRGARRRRGPPAALLSWQISHNQPAR